MNAEKYQFLVGTPITSHAFNQDKSKVALVPNSNEVSIYSKQAQGWTLDVTLTDHDKLVTAVDWAPNTNRIVTCSQDRNAYVWTWEPSSGTWKPTLVLLRINRAATHVRWSPQENKFAVASGSRLISVCYFEEEHNWWVSKHIKKPITSTVLSVDWHPENILLAAGSSDMKARVFSAWIKGVDAKASHPVWGERLPFGTVCGEFPAGGWVHAVSFSPSGNAVAYVSHDSSVTIANGPNEPLKVIKTNLLPFVSLFFANENTIVAAGHDCVPYVVVNQGSQWSLGQKLDTGKKAQQSGNSARAMFQQMDSRNQQTQNDVELNSVHQNTITCARPYKTVGSTVTHFSTSGVDGQLVIWDLMSAGIANLRV
ncbi:WD40-repeat-containing domain protein [Gorgonomyces haynaldii]|nr:WD40-repeat-containing domain protein [Gorgonomyces haynaldii]